MAKSPQLQAEDEGGELIGGGDGGGGGCETGGGMTGGKYAYILYITMYEKYYTCIYVLFLIHKLKF
jgi:hypothetical protein